MPKRSTAAASSCIALGAARQPLLQPFQIEQRPDLGIGVAHGQHQLAESRHQLRRRVVQDREIAMIVRGRARQDTRAAGGQRAFADESR